MPNEALHEIRMRLKKNLIQCPNHKFTNEHLMETFHGALNSNTKQIVDNAACRDFMDCTFTEVTEIFDRLTKISRAWKTRDY